MLEPATRPVLLLGDDGEMFKTLSLLEQILIDLLQDDAEAEDGVGPAQLNAVDRVLMQLHAAERAPAVDLYDPTGRVNYGALRVFCPLVTDLDEIGRCLEVFKEAAGTPHPCYIRETIEDITQGWALDYVENLELASRTLTLDADEDQLLLCGIAVQITGRYVLDPQQDSTHRRFVGRVLAILGNDPLEWFLYRGL